MGIFDVFVPKETKEEPKEEIKPGDVVPPIKKKKTKKKKKRKGSPVVMIPHESSEGNEKG